jgi:uncharacterized Zn-finger protein
MQPLAQTLEAGCMEKQKETQFLRDEHPKHLMDLFAEAFICCPFAERVYVYVQVSTFVLPDIGCAVELL